MTTRFESILYGHVLKWETVFRKGHHGDYAYAVAEDDPDDPGGLTKFGIDQRSHPNIDIRGLDLLGALAIYHADYWLRARCDDLPAPVGEVVFDVAVNNGLSLAAKWLQEAVGAKADGWIGPKTLAAAHGADHAAVARAIIARREGFYRYIARGKREKFLKGWLNRNKGLTKFLNL